MRSFTAFCTRYRRSWIAFCGLFVYVAAILSRGSTSPSIPGTSARADAGTGGTPQSLVSIAVSPASKSIAKGSTQHAVPIANRAQLAAPVANARAAARENNDRPAFRDGVVLVAFRENATRGQQAKVVAEAGAVEARVIGQGVHVLNVPPGHVTQAIQSLARSPDVRYAEPDFRHSLNGAPNDPQFPHQWAFQNTGQTVNGVSGTGGADEGALRAWNVTTGSSSIVVAVVDTGIDYNHPDLAANVWSNPGGINGCAAGTHGYNVLKSSCDPMDDDTVYNGHGTHVAGIIGAVTNNGVGVAGVNWQTSLLGVKWVDANGNGFTSDLIGALEWVIKAKQAGVNVRVVNDSQTWAGTAASQALSDEIDALGSNDILFVTAAGNTAQNNDTTPRYPCVYDRANQICVAASDPNDQLWSSSDYGAQTVDLAAPGVNIFSTLRNSSYGFISGCSMSAAQVSGAAALVLATGDQSVTSLKASLLNAVDLLSAFASTTHTGGRLDICNAIPACSAGPPASTSPPVISGTATAGQMLTTTNGTWSGNPASFAYQWKRCDASGANCGAISGATSKANTLTPTDAGSTIRSAVTATSPTGSSTATSAATSIVQGSTTPATLVQSTSTQASGVPSISQPFATANTQGNLIIAFVRMSSTSQTVTVKDSAGNLYTHAIAQAQSADGHQTHLFYAKNIKSGANTVTATFSGNNNHPWLAIYEFSGLSTTSPLDQVAAAQGSSATASSGLTPHTTASPELVFAGLGLPSSSSVTVTAGSGFTLLQQDATAKTSRAANENAYVSVTGQFAGNFTLSGAANWSAIVATFAQGTPQSLMSIAVSPANPSIVKGSTQQFTATGTYSDGSTRNLTSMATWSSSNNLAATISNTGLANGVGIGNSTIQVASGSVTGSTTLTVTAPVLSSIAVTPANPSIANGTTQQFTATGTYSDGSTQNLTNSAAWSSSNASVATINSAGLATAVGSGTTTIQAASGGVNGSTVLTVTSTATISISVSPATANVQAGGGTQPFTATVSNDPQNKGVNWGLSGAGCSGAACGTLSANSSASGVAITYTAPPGVPSPATVTLTATSVSDSTRSSSATVSITLSTTPTGSTFTESFGNSSSLCWSGGPSSCDQMWVAQGSPQSIVATPGSPPSNTAGANSLQVVEPAGTASYLYTTGTFPRVPSGTAFDLYFTLDVTSQAMQAHDIVRLIAPCNYANGWDYPAQISFGYDGTNLQLQAGGSSSASSVNISLNAWHSVQLHVASGTNASYIVVDGGTQNTFTENAWDFAYLEVGSSTAWPNLDAMTYYIGNVYVNSALGGGPPPSAYIDFENFTNGTTITTDVLAASTHCGNGIWSLSSSPLTGMTISTDGQKQLPSPVTACGTQYTDTTGTRGLRYDISQTAQLANYTWSSTSSSVSVGFFYKITVSDQNYYSVFGITASGGDYAMVHIQGGSMALETKTGVSNSVPVSPNVWYWITMQYNGGGTHYLQLYDTTTWSLVGSVSRAAGGNYQPDGIEIGRLGSETGFPSAYWYYDNIVVDYQTAKFPIVPGAY